MSGIRVTYSGFITFVIGISTIVTGLIFTLIITRELSAEELGIWTLIGGLLVYAVVIEPVISYWTTREIARGGKSAKTALISSSILSTVGISIYLIAVFVVSFETEIDSNVLYFGIILIPITFINRTLSAINYGWKAHTASYGILGFEISKIPLGFLFVYQFDMGVFGAILALTLAYVGSSIILGIFAREKIHEALNFSFVKKWFRLFWISLFPQITNFILKLDVLIFTILTGSVIGLAYYTVSITIGSLVIQSAGISRAVYPKLLSENKIEILQENLTRVFYFAFPLTAISLVFMKPALYALNPIYDVAATVVLFMTLKMFTTNIFSIFYQALLGIEKVDVDERSTFRDYAKSKLFLLPTINIIRSIVYISGLTTLLLTIGTEFSDLDLVILWTIIALVTEIPFTLYSYLLVRRSFQLRFNVKAILKYIFSTIVVFLPMYFITNEYLYYTVSIFEFLPQLIIFVGTSIGLYLITTYLVDEKTRELLKMIINEISNKN
ncbi:MAG: hypothetical protein ACRBB2_09170 [Nitrosopumilus sp.]